MIVPLLIHSMSFNLQIHQKKEKSISPHSRVLKFKFTIWKPLQGSLTKSLFFKLMAIWFKKRFLKHPTPFSYFPNYLLMQFIWIHFEGLPSEIFWTKICLLWNWLIGSGKEGEMKIVIFFFYEKLSLWHSFAKYLTSWKLLSQMLNVEPKKHINDWAIPLLKRFVVGLWNKCTARFSPYHSSPLQFHAPLDIL